MILEFSVKNFRSIKEIQTVSFLATKLESNREKYPDVDANNIVEDSNNRVLKTVGIYGANASGKSNIIHALDAFQRGVGELPSPVSRLGELADPFLYQENAGETECFFQIVVLIDGNKYRYGFTVKKNSQFEGSEDSRELITNEWLFGPKNTNQTNYFTRTGLEIKKGYMIEGLKTPDLQFRHTLFLTHVASFDSRNICGIIWRKIRNDIASDYSMGLDAYRYHTIEQLRNDIRKYDVLHFLENFNLNYSDILLDEEGFKFERFPQGKVFLKKGNYQNVTLNLERQESEGTKKMFDLVGLLNAAFNYVNRSSLIILDELDSNFHPSLVIKILNLFNNPEVNKKNAQILFSSHDTNLMNPALMRRDQFYFTEKNGDDATRLYSLADLKGIRNDADFAKQYLAGYYGAVPVLKEFVYSNQEKNSDNE